MKTYRSREDVPTSEKWDLTDLFETVDDWEKAYQSIENKVEQLRSFEGSIDDGQTLYRYLKLEEDVRIEFKKLYVYAMLSVDIDTKDTNAQALLDRAKQLSVKITSSTAFFMPFLLSLEEEMLKRYIESEKRLTYFEKELFDAYRYKNHVLNKDQEQILSELGDALSAPSYTFSMINNADIQFGTVTTESGEKVELTRGMYAKRIKDKNRSVRKEAYRAYYKPYIALKNTIASTLSAAIKNNVTIARLRNYRSALEKALFADRIPTDVFEHLIATTRANLAPLHKYEQIRKEFLRVDELRAYDLNVPLVEERNDEISYDDAFETMLKSLAPLGDEYVETLRRFKEMRYFDVRETPGKRSGAYNIGVYGVHPFVLLNFHDDLNSLFTLVHESGHAMHSWYSAKFQPPIHASYSIFVAEVASTVNEILLIRYLLNETDDKERRKYLLNYFIDSFKGTFFTQVMFSEFEQRTHEKAERGEPLNADVFCQIYEELFQAYHSDLLVCDDEVKYGWARIPHFYRPFYVYKYATGYAAALYIADRIFHGDEQLRNRYLQFLKSGRSDYPLPLLQKTGVDLTKPEFFEETMRIFTRLVDEFAAYY